MDNIVCTSNGEYTMLKCAEGMWKGYWEVKHYWNDGGTIQSRYFAKKSEAEKYISGKIG